MNANLQGLSLNIFYLFFFLLTDQLTSVTPRNLSRTVYLNHSKKKEEKPIVLFYDISYQMEVIDGIGFHEYLK